MLTGQICQVNSLRGPIGEITMPEGGCVPFTHFLAQVTNWPCPHHWPYEPNSKHVHQQRASQLESRDIAEALLRLSTFTCSQFSASLVMMLSIPEFLTVCEQKQIVWFLSNVTGQKCWNMKEAYYSKKPESPCSSFQHPRASPGHFAHCSYLGFLSKAKSYHVTALFGNLWWLPTAFWKSSNT